jgi:hypothetical protein
VSGDDFDFENQESSSFKSADGLVSVEMFKGRPVLVLRRTPDDKYPMSFGIGKARLILDNYQAIQDFVNKNQG